MQIQKSNRAAVPKRRALTMKRLTDKLDMFALPVYQFTFEDSYLVSTGLGALCTLVLLVVVTMLTVAKIAQFAEQSADRFIVTDGLEHGYFDPTMEFNRYNIAIGLSYKPQY